MKHTHRHRLFPVTLVIIYLSLLFFQGYRILSKPAYNGDILSYMALILLLDTGNNAHVHDNVYLIAKKEIPEWKYKELTETTPKRKEMAVNSKLFMSNIPFYIVKPLYVFCVFIFYKMGVSLILATVLPSIIAYILIAGLLYYWVSMYYKPLVCFLFCAVFCTSNMIFNVARLSTPDMLSGFFIFMAIFFLLETSNKLLSYTFLLLALFTRLDNIIFGGTVIILLFLKKSLQQSITLRQSLLALTGLVVSAFIVTLGLRQFGWNVFFIQDFTKNLSYESNMVYTKEVYLKTLPITLKYTLQNTELPFFLFLSGMLLFQKISKWTLDNWLALLFVSLVILRYVLYPFTHNRFYVGYYFIITMLLLRSIYKYAILQKAT